MKLLVTTPRNLYLADVATRRVEQLRSGDGEYFGLSWDRDLVAVSHSHHDYDTLRTPEDYHSSVTGNVAIHRGVAPPVWSERCLVAPHQMLVVQGRVVVTNTGRNAITVFDPDGKVQAHRRYGDAEWDLTERGRVGHHFNSLYFAHGYLHVVAHNNGRKSEVWVLEWPTLDPKDVIPTDTEWAHNYWECELGRIVCNSRFGSLVDIASGETVWNANEQPIVTRGLAANGDYLFVGRSEYGNRIQRRWNHGGIWVIDRKTLRTVDRLILPFSGCVNDIRLVDMEDECHPNGILGADRLARLRRLPTRNKLAWSLSQSRAVFPYLARKWKVGMPPR